MKNGEALGAWGKKLVLLLEKYKFVFLVILAGVVLLMLPSFGGGEGEEEAAMPADSSGGAFDLEATEGKLEEALSRIDGAGKVKVVLTLRSGTRQILATDAPEDERVCQRGQVLPVGGEVLGVRQVVGLGFQPVHPLVPCRGPIRPQAGTLSIHSAFLSVHALSHRINPAPVS